MSKTKYWRLVAATLVLLAALTGTGAYGKEEVPLGEGVQSPTAGSTAQGVNATIQTEGRATYEERLYTARPCRSISRSDSFIFTTEGRPVQGSLGSGKDDKQGEPSGLGNSPARTERSEDQEPEGAAVGDVSGGDSGADYRGVFLVTAYTAGYESTGKRPGDQDYGITASGTTVEEGRTIAADWRVLPPGTRVYIEDIGERTVEDKGGAVKGKHIDLFIEDLDTALEWGRRDKKLYVIEWGRKD